MCVCMCVRVCVCVCVCILTGVKSPVVKTGCNVFIAWSELGFVSSYGCNQSNCPHSFNQGNPPTPCNQIIPPRYQNFV